MGMRLFCGSDVIFYLSLANSLLSVIIFENFLNFFF